MKKIIVTFLLCLTVGVSMAAERDTVGISSDVITRFVEHPSVSSKGKKYIKYFAIVNNELVPVSKSVYEAVTLSREYGTKCTLIAIRDKKTKKIIRIKAN